jgi:chromosome segregation ATPase
MFIFRILRSIWYAITGKGNRAADGLLQNTDVIAGNFDHIVKEKRGRINTFKDAISTLVAQQETKKQTLKAVSGEVARLEQLKAGALAQGKKVVERLGGDQAKAAGDPDFAKHQAAYRDFSSTLEEKKKRVAELEGDIETQGKTISSYTGQIQTLMRELEKIAAEKHETIADVIGAQQQKQVADIVSNLAEDTTSQELQSLRDMRMKAKASAKVSQSLSGLDTKSAEDEYVAAAGNSAHDDEFSKLMFGNGEKAAEAPAPAAPLPEA